jgi:hypothetical protein
LTLLGKISNKQSNGRYHEIIKKYFRQKCHK